MAGAKIVTVLGAGSWGTTLANHLAQNGCRVCLWSRSSSQAGELAERRENNRYLPGIKLSRELTITGDLEQSVAGSDYVVFSVPSHSFSDVLQISLPYLKPGTVIINTAKGIEEHDYLRMSQVFARETGSRYFDYVVLSGPSHAEEVALKMPTAVVAASVSGQAATRVQDIFMSNTFRVYTNPDIIGVELGGALKNIIALGTGIVDGLSGSDNAKAALMTRGLAEITRLGVAMHANPLTFAGLAGLGDLIVTCTSRHSRNRRAGIEIGKGRKLEEVLADINMVVEGVRTTRAAQGLARQCGVEMPIVEQMYQVLFHGLTPVEGMKRLLGRDKAQEVEEVALARIKWWIEQDEKS